MAAFRGQTIILTPVEERRESGNPSCRRSLRRMERMWRSWTQEEHDEIMAVVQALTHFAYISIGAALRTLDFDVERSRRFMSRSTRS